MQAKVINKDQQETTYAVIFDTGDEFISGLTGFAEEHGLDASGFKAIGAFQHAKLGYFDIEKKDYKEIPVEGQVEVLSLVGDIALDDGHPKVHAHVVLGRSDGSTVGGHILEATVRPTLEVVLTESPAHLRRKSDPDTGLALIDLEE
ncbi:MAG: PPC domain-containing DNA-binding protein [Thermomicrobiales bacterium]